MSDKQDGEAPAPNPEAPPTRPASTGISTHGEQRPTSTTTVEISIHKEK